MMPDFKFEKKVGTENGPDVYYEITKKGLKNGGAYYFAEPSGESFVARLQLNEGEQKIILERTTGEYETVNDLKMFSDIRELTPEELEQAKEARRKYKEENN